MAATPSAAPAAMAIAILNLVFITHSSLLVGLHHQIACRRERDDDDSLCSPIWQLERFRTRANGTWTRKGGRLRTRAEPSCLESYVPTDGVSAASIGNGDFDTSPF